ncbi:MAG TPA: DMT family transporter [Rubrivivax sp.]
MRSALHNWQLFAIAVLVWGTTWHAIVYQLAHTSPAFGVALRFGAAGAAVLAWCAWRGEQLRFSAPEHARLALQGAFMYSVSYLCIYHAERFVPSGLVAVGYSASPLLLGVVAWALWRTPLTRRFLFGGVLCLAGVVLIFWPELAQMTRGTQALRGAAFTASAVLLSAVGSLIASRNKGAGLPFWPALGYGMLYSSAVSWLFVVGDGQVMAWPASLSWWLSWAYLSIFGSVLAFACYLTLQQRLGPGAASTVGTATPVIALLVSTAFEGYRPGLVSVLGILLAVVGNLLILGARVSSAASPAAE